VRDQRDDRARIAVDALRITAIQAIASAHQLKVRLLSEDKRTTLCLQPWTASTIMSTTARQLAVQHDLRRKLWPQGSVRRFSSTNDIEYWIARGVPVAVSSSRGKGQLTDAAVSSSGGDLSVVVRFDKGDPIVKDPADDPDDGEVVKRTYLRSELEPPVVRELGRHGLSDQALLRDQLAIDQASIARNHPKLVEGRFLAVPARKMAKACFERAPRQAPR